TSTRGWLPTSRFFRRVIFWLAGGIYSPCNPLFISKGRARDDGCGLFFILLSRERREHGPKKDRERRGSAILCKNKKSETYKETYKSAEGWQSTPPVSGSGTPVVPG